MRRLHVVKLYYKANINISFPRSADPLMYTRVYLKIRTARTPPQSIRSKRLAGLRIAWLKMTTTEETQEFAYVLSGRVIRGITLHSMIKASHFAEAARIEPPRDVCIASYWANQIDR